VGRDPISKRKIYLERTFRGSKRDAERELARLVAENDGSMPRRGRESTVTELLKLWADFTAPNVSPRTAMVERGYIRSVIVPAIGHLNVSKVTPIELDRFYKHLVAVGGSKGPYSPASVIRVHGILRRAFAQAVRWGWVRHNPVIDASPPRSVPTLLGQLSPSDVANILDEAGRRDPQLAAFIHLAASTGARRGELLALRWIDLDLEKRTATPKRGIVLADGALIEQGTKTHQSRTISLDPETVRLLTEHRARKLALAHNLGADFADDCFVFSDAADCQVPLRPDSISRTFRAVCERAGVRGVRLHDLRHYVATRLLTAGIDPRTVAGRLGHRNASTTLDVYAQFVPEADEWAADVLATILEKANSV
jgi:integrase